MTGRSRRHAHDLVGSAAPVAAALLAAVSLTSWYAALVLGVIGKWSASYVEILAYYAVAIVIVALVLKWIRTHLHGSTKV